MVYWYEHTSHLSVMGDGRVSERENRIPSSRSAMWCCAAVHKASV